MTVIALIHYRANKDDKNSLAYDNVWALAEDADRNIWVGTLGQGIAMPGP